MSLKYLQLLSLLVQFSHSVMSYSLQPHGLQHSMLPCLTPTPRAFSNSCPSSRWWHLTISSSVIPFSSCLQSFPASGSFQMSQFFASGGQSTGASASASVLPMNVRTDFLEDWLVWSPCSPRVRGNRVIVIFGVRTKFKCEITDWKLEKLLHFSFLFCAVIVLI